MIKAFLLLAAVVGAWRLYERHKSYTTDYTAAEWLQRMRALNLGVRRGDEHLPSCPRGNRVVQ